MPNNPQEQIIWDDNTPREEITWDDARTPDLAVSQDIIDRVINVESSGNPKAVSKKGAVGLMQLMPATARAMGATDPTDPEQNIQAGTKYINAMYRKYGGDINKTLAAYNWGPTRLDRLLKTDPQGWMDKIPEETRNYIAKISGNRKNKITEQVAWNEEIEWDRGVVAGGLDTVKDIASDIGQNLVGKGEAALSTLSGLLATPVAGLAGLVTSAGGLYPERGAQTVEDVSNLLTYRPQTERGRRDVETLNYPLELMDKGGGWIGEKVSDITGSPELGAIFKAGVMLGLPVAGGRVVRGVGKTLKPIEATVETAPRIPTESPTLRPVPSEAINKAETPTITDFANMDRYEAYVKGGSTSPLPKYAGKSSINLERFDTTMDVKQLVNQLAKENEAKIGKKTVTWDKTRQAALDLAWDEKDFLKAARTKGSFNAAEIDAMRTVHANAISDLQKTLREIPADRSQITDTMRLDVLDKINNYVEVMKATSGKSSEAGRALNIHKRMIAEDPDYMASTNMQKAMKQIMEKRGGKKLTDDLLNDLKGVDWSKPADVKEIIKKYNKASPGDMVYEAWLNGILSHPATHATNILSNAMTLGTKVPEHAIASILRREFPLGEMRAETIGMMQGLKEGVRAGVKAFKSGEASEMWNKVETARTPAIPGKVGEAVRIPTKALTGADEFFKAIVYRSEYNRLAFLEAKKTGARGQMLAEKMAELLDNPSAEMLDGAHQEALYRTFNKPLGRWGNRIMAMRNEAQPLKFLFPFIRTPANIAKYTLERTPMAVGRTMLDIHRGNLTKAQMYDAFAREAIGTMVGVVVYQMTKEGTVTGGGPKNKAERETKYRTGWQPYSVKIGDTYYPYNRLEYLGSIMGMTADLAEAADMDGDKELSEKFGKIAASFAKNITSKTFMQGLSNLLDATSDPDRYGNKAINQLAGSVVPSIVGGVARAKDATVYETETPLDTIKARMGMTGGMFPKRDIWGRQIERPGTATTRMMSPMNPSQGKNDPVDIEMDRLNLAIAQPAKKIAGVELTPEEYDTYTRKAGETARLNVERYMSSPEYSMMRDELKKIAVRNIVEKARTRAGMELWKNMARERRFKPMDKKYGTHLGGQD